MNTFRRLDAVSKLLGGVPSRLTLQRWARSGQIEAGTMLGGSVIVMSDEQIRKLVKRLEAGDLGGEQDRPRDRGRFPGN